MPPQVIPVAIKGLCWIKGEESTDGPEWRECMSGFQGRITYTFSEKELVVARLSAANSIGSGVYELALNLAAAATLSPGVKLVQEAEPETVTPFELPGGGGPVSEE